MQGFSSKHSLESIYGKKDSLRKEIHHKFITMALLFTESIGRFSLHKTNCFTRIAILFSCLLLLPFIQNLTTLNAQPDNNSSIEGQVSIEWSAQRGVNEYVLEIHRQGELVHRQTYRQNRATVNLAAGNYERRVGAVDRLGGVRWSRWQPLQIIVSRIPEIRNIYPPALAIENESGQIEIQADHILDVTEVTIRSGDRHLPIISREIQNGRLIVTVDTSQAESAEYDLILENPNNRTVTHPEPVIVGPENEIAGIIRRADRETEPSASRPTDTDRTDPSTTIFSAYPYWKLSIPGYVQIQRQESRGYLLMSGFFASLGFAYHQSQQANSIINERDSDPTFLPISEPAIAFALAENIEPGLIGAGLLNDAERSSRYNNHIRNYNTALGLAVIFYTLHWLDLWKVPESSSISFQICSACLQTSSSTPSIVEKREQSNLHRIGIHKLIDNDRVMNAAILKNDVDRSSRDSFRAAGLMFTYRF